MPTPTPSPLRKPGAASAGSNDGSAAASASDEVARLLGTQRPPINVPMPNGEAVASEVQTPSVPTDIEIDLGEGAVRKMPRDELARLVRSAEQIESTRAEADRLLKRSAGAVALDEHLSKMDPAMRSRVLQAIQDPDAFFAEQPAPRAAPRGRQVDQVVDGNRRESGDDLRSEIAQMKSVLSAIASHVKSDLDSRAQQTLGQQIDAEMKTFPVFSEESDGANWAKEAIATELSQKPQAPLREIVAKHAGHLHKILAKNGVRPPAQSPDSRGNLRPPLQAPKDRPLTANDLNSGGVAAAIRRQLGG